MSGITKYTKLHKEYRNGVLYYMYGNTTAKAMEYASEEAFLEHAEKWTDAALLAKHYKALHIAETEARQARKLMRLELSFLESVALKISNLLR